MKKLILMFAFLFGFAFLATSQTNKVDWSAKAEKISDDTYKVTIVADVEDGWYIYSQYMEDGGPIPTVIEFEGNNFKIDGKTEEAGEITKEMYDEVFEIDIKKFGNKAVFTQIVRTDGYNTPQINALVTFMSCNDERCNPPRKVKVEVAL